MILHIIAILIPKNSFAGNENYSILIKGDLSNDNGTALEAANRLQAIISDLKKTPQTVIIRLVGRFLLETPLIIRNVPRIQIDGQRATSFLPASKDVSDAIRADQADHLLISGINFIGFRDNGLFIKDSRNVTIQDVSAEGTRSSQWSQGAIHLTGSIQNSKIINNNVIDADFAGIVVDTTKVSDISGLRIIGNKVTNTCKVVKDCGAIYVNDRGRRSHNILIENNTVVNFGNPSVGGRGIYIDDWASNVTARNNYIVGPGRFAFQIHGGHDNNITDNRIQMNKIEQFLLYQQANDGTRSVMMNNYVDGNTLVNSRGSRAIIIRPVDRQGSGAVHSMRNQLCIASLCTSLP